MPSKSVPIVEVDETVQLPGDLFEACYDRLRRVAAMLMADEPAGHTLQATALVNEAFVRLVGGGAPTPTDQRRFVNAAVTAMRHILIDRARRCGRLRHGGGRRRVTLQDVEGDAADFPLDRFEELDTALRKLEVSNERWGEVARLRFLAGLTVEQVAGLMSISPALVKRDWQFARVWLVANLGTDGGGAA